MHIAFPPQVVVIGALLLCSGLALLGGPVGEAARGVLRGAGYAVLSLLAVAGAMWVTLAGGGPVAGGGVLLGALGIGLIVGAMFSRSTKAVR